MTCGRGGQFALWALPAALALSAAVLALPGPLLADGGSGSGYAAAVLADSPRGFWRLGELSGTQAADASGNGFAGTYLNGVGLGSAGALSGDTNTAASFDGSDDAVTVAGVADFPDTAPFTIEAWIKPAVVDGGVYRRVLSSEWTNGGQRNGIVLQLNSGYGITVQRWVNGAALSASSGADTIAAGSWQHVAGSYDGATLRIYVDGVLKASRTDTRSLASSTEAITIGRSNTGGNLFQGDIDEVALYPAALTASQLDAHRNAASGPPPPDTTPPETTIDTGPTGTVSATDATFTFSADEAATFECSLDSAPYTPCTSPTQYTGLATGPHTFTVRATDTAANTDPTPATRTWTITGSGDTTPPETTIESAPADVGFATSATFTFSSSEPGSTFECSLDGAGYAACASPQTYSSLAFGEHAFSVRAIDPSTNVDESPASRLWTIVSPPPPAGGPYSDAVRADTPTGYWRLGDPAGQTLAQDASGGGYDGTFMDGAEPGVAGALSGEADTGARLDGVDDYVNLDGVPSTTGTAPFALEAWVKPSVVDTTYRRVLSGEWTEGGQRHGILLQLNATYGFTIQRWVNGAGLGASSKATIVPGTWYHVVGTYDGSTLRIFVNGSLKASRVDSRSLTSSPAAVYLGRATTGGNHFQGDVDEVAVYPASLSAARVGEHFAVGTAGDPTPPTVTLTTPAPSAVVTDLTPVFSGTSGTDPGDAMAVTVSVYAGSGATGSPLQTFGTTKDAFGAWASDALDPLAPGAYSARAEQSDLAGNVGTSAAVDFTVQAPPAYGADPVLLAAGDIANCYSSGDEATGAILAANPSATVAALGDNAYEEGSTRDYTDCYEPSWGHAKARTRPALGDHEYLTRDARGYFDYFGDVLAPFGASATDPERGWYSYDLGAWHVVVLNSNCTEVGGCGTGSAQDVWLRADLAAHPTACTLAYFQEPRFSSGPHGNSLDMQPLWQALYDLGADVVLGGNDHMYERFAPQTPTGMLDLAAGLTGFVVGTGGSRHYSFADGILKGNSQARNDDAFGVLELVLHPDSFEWQFLPEAGKTFSDAGSRPCH